MMLLWVSPTPSRSRVDSSAAGNPLPRTSPARSLVPTKTNGSVCIATPGAIPSEIAPGVAMHADPLVFVGTSDLDQRFGVHRHPRCNLGRDSAGGGDAHRT